uniref:Anaphase-promoting complex subunit 4 WD40 domain-containing protein n=1 Tax=Physcomitrium patens TaxID=3218 RepID=A0A7I4EKH9_PHYPA
MKLVAGSYERFLWGYDVKLKKQELQWKFAYPAHIGAIKCIASSGAVVATGGADDTIRIFDLNAQKDMGSLYKHEGAVTCLDFHNSHPSINHPTHLLSGSEDGSICIWDTDAWVHLLTMKAKKGPKSAVQDLSIHVSGLLALSIERNHNMKMWNLTKGRCSFTTKLPSEAEIVKFFPQSGESYALVLGTALEIRNAETGSTIHRLQHDKKVFCIAQREDNLLVTGGEDCIVRGWDTRSGKQAWSIANAHSNRIKGVAILRSKSATDENTGEPPVIVASASSDGLLKVWDTRMVRSNSGAAPAPLLQAETKARLTCLVSSSGVKSLVLKEGLFIRLSFLYRT